MGDRSQYVQTKLPDSYLIELDYKGRIYRINDKDLYKTVNTGDLVKIRIIEKVDKYKDVISYKLESIKKIYQFLLCKAMGRNYWTI